MNASQVGKFMHLISNYVESKAELVVLQRTNYYNNGQSGRNASEIYRWQSKANDDRSHLLDFMQKEFK